MAIRIEERFVVKAEAGPVWEYLVDPRQVVTCLPGAELVEVADERTFHGNVKVKVGTVTVSYRGKVLLAEVDHPARRVKMIGEGRESTGSGSAKMTMESRVTDLPEGGAEIVVQAELDVVGRIVQLGRGMIEQVAHQLFQQFSGCVRVRLEAEASQRRRAAAGVLDVTAPVDQPPRPPPAPEPVRLIPLVLRAFWAWIASLFRRGEGRGAR
jgi:carbon monoxide dehydrogenase subunit G